MFWLPVNKGLVCKVTGDLMQVNKQPAISVSQIIYFSMFGGVSILNGIRM